MPITLLCPRLTCRAVLCVPDNVRGKHVKCGECGVTLLVPSTRPPEPARMNPPPNEASDEPNKG